MNNIMKTIIMFSSLACSAIFSSDVVTNKSSTITKTSADVTNGAETTPTQSTTHTTTTSTTENSIDDDIVSAIYDKFSNHPALIGTTLVVTSQNSIVTINGTVTAQSQADAALITAKSVDGVKDVRSLINIITNPDLNKPNKTPNY